MEPDVKVLVHAAHAVVHHLHSGIETVEKARELRKALEPFYIPCPNPHCDAGRVMLGSGGTSECLQCDGKGKSLP